MAKTDAWMPWYIGSYLADTMHLSTLEHGAYLLLLAYGWRHDGKIGADDQLLARITRLPLDQWKAIRPTIEPFFIASEDPMLGACWMQKRQVDELAKAKERQVKAEEKARIAAEARWGKRDEVPSECLEHATSIAQALHKECPSPSPTPINANTENTPLTPQGGKVKKGRPRAARTMCPEDFEITDDIREYCARKGLPRPEPYRDGFVNYWRGRGDLRADWVATFRAYMESPYRKDPPRGANNGWTAGQRKETVWEHNARVDAERRARYAGPPGGGADRPDVQDVQPETSGASDAG